MSDVQWRDGWTFATDRFLLVGVRSAFAPSWLNPERALPPASFHVASMLEPAVRAPDVMLPAGALAALIAGCTEPCADCGGAGRRRCPECRGRPRGPSHDCPTCTCACDGCGGAGAVECSCDAGVETTADARLAGEFFDPQRLARVAPHLTGRLRMWAVVECVIGVERLIVIEDEAGVRVALAALYRQARHKVVDLAEWAKR